MFRYMTLMVGFTTICYTNTTERRALIEGASSPMPVVESFITRIVGINAITGARTV